MDVQPWLHQKRRAKRRKARAERTFDSLVHDLRSREPISGQAAEHVAAAVLCALELRLAGGAQRDLEAQLPGKLRELVRTCPLHFGRKPRKLDRDEMVAIVAEETGTTRREAERLTRAVLGVIRDHVSAGEVAQVISQLPKEIAELWQPALDW